MASSFEQSTTKTPKKQKIRTVIRNAKEQEWANISVIPDKGELVYASDVNTLKIGDGVTVYDNLPAISGGGSGGTTDYTDLTNKPQIDGVTLVGNVSAADLGFANVATSGNYNDLSNLPTLGTMAAENAGDYTKTSSFSNVAFTGSYDDLVNKPSFGTAAYANTTDFATAAQGDLANTAVQPSDLAIVATTGNYNDLTNKPTIPAAQVNADWNASSGVAEILNKPSFGTAAFANTTDFATSAQGNLATTAVQPGDLANVATTGSYDDLTNKPYIPAGVVVDLTYDPLSVNAQAGTAVAEAIANKQDTLINGTNIKSINGNTLLGSGDLELDGLPSQSGQSGKFLTTNGTDASWSSLANVAISGEYNDLLNKPTLANVALSGDYNDLTNKPVLGSAAYANTSDFATAAEGNLATTAVQPGDLAVIATTGDYSDLLNTPTIPTNISQLNNDAGYVVSTSLSNVAFTGNYEDLTNTPTLGSMAYANTSDYTTTSNLANVALSGEYSDLLNKPTIPDPQIQSDWNQTNTSAVDYIKNKPTIPEGVVVDQVYNGTSTNAQSGTAVAEAIATKSVVVLREW